MSDAARLARQTFATKSAGLVYSRFSPPPQAIAAILDKVSDAAVESAYSSLVSFAEALAGLKAGSSAWGVVRLYYSSFYSIRALLYLRNLVPFNCNGEMMLDITSGRFLKGGKSSHHWNWTSIRLISAEVEWFASQDSQDAYETLRSYRENVNYTHSFTDPVLHPCLSEGSDLGRRVRTYREDDQFFYTYLPNHLALAYPAKLIFYLDSELSRLNITLPAEQALHVQRLWSLNSRCPLI